MGYYSDVAIALKKADFHKMESEVYFHIHDKDMQKLTKKVLALAEKTEVERNAEDYLVLRWPYIKWDNCFGEVKYIRDFLLKLIHYDFVRIGEDYDDIEVYHNTGHCLVDIERSIAINNY